jgi:hypothetical protein
MVVAVYSENSSLIRRRIEGIEMEMRKIGIVDGKRMSGFVLREIEAILSR